MAAVDGEVSDALVERVLARLGIAAPPATRDGLATIYGAWCRSVPWDNVQKRIAVVERRPVLAGAYPHEFFENFLQHGTGGTCWPSAGALHALLRHLGFDARRGIAAMAEERQGRLENHATTIVRLDGEDLVVDSSILNGVPLPLRDGAHSDDPARRARVERRPDEWAIWWLPPNIGEELSCVILEPDTSFEGYLERYEASRVRGLSYALRFTKGLAGGVLTVTGSRRAFRANDGTLITAIVPDRDRVLVEEGGLSRDIVARLPPDEPDPYRPAPAS